MHKVLKANSSEKLEYQMKVWSQYWNLKIVGYSSTHVIDGYIEYSVLVLLESLKEEFIESLEDVWNVIKEKLTQGGASWSVYAKGGEDE